MEKGQLLLEVQSPILEEKEHYLESKVNEEVRFLKDLNRLTNSKKSAANIISDVITPLYRQALTDYLHKLGERQVHFRKIKQDFDRNKKLYDQGVIATSDFENYAFELEKAQRELDLQKQSQLSAWQQELSSHEKELADNNNQLIQTQYERQILNIIAPVTGTIQNLVGIYPGSPVFANQDLAQISPETDLIAEVYVSPHDIGLLHEGMEVRMQISAFNYNQWGLLQGKVVEISNDIRIKNEMPVFEILCSLNQDHLRLKNGYQGKLRKGMTLQARFVVAERSLWQLLYDKVDDWTNPNIMH